LVEPFAHDAKGLLTPATEGRDKIGNGAIHVASAAGLKAAKKAMIGIGPIGSAGGHVAPRYIMQSIER
jgi:hypothetical protein